MEVLKITSYHVGGYIIFLHQFLVGVAIAANLNRLNTESRCTRVLNGMRFMTISAYGYIIIIIIYEGFTMDTLSILVYYFWMTLGTSS
jgi:glucose uptake protein GlcU